MQKIKKATILVLALILVLAAFPIGVFTVSAATSGTTGDCTWMLDGTVLTISGSGDMGDYETRGPWGRDVTKIIVNYGVKSIGANAFDYCQTLTSVTLPQSLTSIGTGAFDTCKSLTAVKLPTNIKSIEDKAFYGCSGLTEIVIPNSVTNIGKSAFYGCSALTKITIPFIGGSATENTFFGYIFGASSYSSNYTYIPSSLATVVLSDKCTSLADYAFYNCFSIQNITLSKNIKSIGTKAFHQCNITNIVIPEGVETIGQSAFIYCDNLETITIPKSLKSIGSSAFSDCKGLKGVYISDLAAWCSMSFSSNPLGNAKNLYLNNQLVTDLVIPNTIQSICNNAFNGCTSIVSVNIPNNITSIGASAFYNCSGITEINIPDSVTTIGNTAFYGCSKLTNIIVPDSVNSIGKGAFSYCSGLSDITLPFIGGTATQNTFLGYIFGAMYSSENSVHIPTSLKKVTVSENCSSIGNFAFYNCQSIETVTLTDKVVSIGISAFNTGNITVNYLGTKTLWNKISIGTNNVLTEETICYIVDGDINGDGELAAEDLTSLRAGLLQSYTDTKYDINQNGTIDIIDLIVLKKLFAGIA